MKAAGYASSFRSSIFPESARRRSIVRLDKAMSIKVGPNSAGAVPGPACYAMGGEDPTVTDATSFWVSSTRGAVAADGAIDAARSHSSVMERIASRSPSLLETAYGFIRWPTQQMRAVKGSRPIRGRDPRDFSLYAFGGNGGVHGVELARSAADPAVNRSARRRRLQRHRTAHRQCRADAGAGSALAPRARWTSEKSSRRSPRWKTRSSGQLGYARDGVTFLRFADLRIRPGLSS